MNIFEITNENQLAHIYEPEPGIFIAESPLVIGRALDAGYEVEAFLREKVCEMSSDADEAGSQEAATAKILARCPNAQVIEKSHEEMQSYRGYEMTRGLVAAMRRKALPSAEEILKNLSGQGTEAGSVKKENPSTIVILEDVENPTNVGAIFRSAAALNIGAVLLTRDCADPLYRRAARVSMGNVFNIPWTYIDKVSDVQELGYKAAALALRDNTISIEDKKLKETPKLALVLGAEGTGLKQETIDGCDYAVKIPMKPGVDSLNVSVAAAIAMWELGK